MTTSSDYPRLLLITPNAFNCLSGGGVTFTNLFKGWPRDRIATAHADKIPPSMDICDNYYFLGKKEFPWLFPFSLAAFLGGQEKAEERIKKRESSIGGNFMSKAVPFFQRFVRNEIPTRAVVTKGLSKFIENFKPQVIYTILGSLPYIRLVRLISKKYNLPVVLHMMDDWPAVRYRGIFDFYRRRRMKVELKALMKEAAACLSICDAMSEAFEKRYGRKFTAFHNALDADSWIKKARKDWSRKSPFNILYAGALMPDSQLESVCDAADAVADLKSGGLDVQFKIYAPWYFANLYRKKLEREGCVQVFDMPQSMDVEDLFTGADLLLLPVNFDKASVKYIKYSMPTKVPAYMFCGTPTLAYGPASVASIKYAQKWAHCVTKRDKKELSNAIKELASKESLRKNLGLRAQELAKGRHDAAKVRAEFHKVLIDAAG